MFQWGAKFIKSREFLFYDEFINSFFLFENWQDGSCQAKHIVWPDFYARYENWNAKICDFGEKLLLSVGIWGKMYNYLQSYGYN